MLVLFSFTHVIKATEPVVGMLVLLAFTGKIAPWWVNACLAPIVGGVVYAGIKPGTAFGMGDLLGYASVAALASTVAFSIAKLLAKVTDDQRNEKKHNLTPANNYAVLTVCSTLVLLLPSALGEGPAALAAIKAMPNPMGFRPIGRMRLFVLRLQRDGLSGAGFIIAGVGGRRQLSQESCGFVGCRDLPRREGFFEKIIGSSVAMAGVLLYSAGEDQGGEAAAQAREDRRRRAEELLRTWAA